MLFHVKQDREAARYAARQHFRALRRTGFTPPHCRDCASTKVEMHHPDYRYPLDVVWLCKKHHNQEDRRRWGPKNSKGRPKMNAPSPKTPVPADVHIGARVRLRRMMLGMSQEALGKSMGITFQQIQKYEKGTNRIGGSRMAQIATALTVPVAFFYEGMAGASHLVEGTHPDDSVAEIMAFLRTREGIRLNRAVVHIASKRARSKLVALAEAMAGIDSPDER